MLCFYFLDAGRAQDLVLKFSSNVDTLECIRRVKGELRGLVSQAFTRDSGSSSVLLIQFFLGVDQKMHDVLDVLRVFSKRPSQLVSILRIL
ncbi:MAG: hypothetical protein KVP17_004871 [Porospora cf. gigantea B]|uniref:uncharacterized protein n=1 Tax=Porospora cf. gigantea B TaxID=2853592 RepID=UPI003571D5F8|nr:MAG: hypothetical protein KVP17_004871 [Porospora cf. gigantea B]